MKVVVNSKDCEWDGTVISFDQVLDLAGRGQSYGMNYASKVKYTHDETQWSGELKKGQYLKVREGMAFTVVFTR